MPTSAKAASTKPGRTSDGNKVEMRSIKAGQEGGGQSVVLQGLSSGETAVIAGQYRLQPGTLVQPSKANSPNTPDKAAQNAPAKAP